jgi:hypothetical protein
VNSDRFVYACREDPTILPSLLSVVEKEVESSMARLAQENEEREIYRYQGEVRKMRAFEKHLKDVVKLKDEQPRVRAVR